MRGLSSSHRLPCCGHLRFERRGLARGYGNGLKQIYGDQEAVRLEERQCIADPALVGAASCVVDNQKSRPAVDGIMQMFDKNAGSVLRECFEENGISRLRWRACLLARATVGWRVPGLVRNGMDVSDGAI